MASIRQSERSAPSATKLKAAAAFSKGASTTPFYVASKGNPNTAPMSKASSSKQTFQGPATPFYVAAPGNPNTAPMSESSSAQGTANRTLAQRAAIANDNISDSTFVKSSPNYTPAKPASITSKATTSGAAGGSYSPPARPTPSSEPSSPTTTKPETPAPTPPPTDSGGVGGTVRTPENSGGVGRNARRGQNVTNRKNPRVSRSLTIDELKKQAARNLGI